MSSKGPVTHGMASSIRSATESETFDLGGLGPDTIENTVADALSEPFSARDEMIRITLVVGGGKQSRQKYHAQAMKVVTSTLQQKCGFVEDRGASCVMECQGMYKVQHDTGKNLKTVVLFPKVDAASSKSSKHNSSSYSNESQASEQNMIFPVKSMEYKAAASSLSVFQNMVKVKCRTWSQKKALLQLIEQEFVQQIMDPVEDLLMRGQVVPSDLQHCYDNVLVEISEKQQFVKQAVQEQVELGNLMENELNFLLEQVEHRIQALSTKSNTPNPALTKARERRRMLKSFTPVAIPKLQHHAALGKLWKQVYAIPIPLDLDGNSGRLLSVQESKLVAKRDDLFQEIEQLEYASQGWLEDDESFEWRLQECRNEFEQRFATSKNRAGNKTRTGASYSGATGSNRSSSQRPVTKWITPVDKKGATAVAKKKNKVKKQDLFSAMMAASSSEEEDSDDEVDRQEPASSWQQLGAKVGASNTTSQKSTVKPARKSDSQQNNLQTKETTDEQVVNSVGSKKKRNRKKKKGKASNSDANQTDEGKSSELESESSISESIPMAILHVILHVIMAMLTWLISLVLGSKSKKKSKKKKRS
ncbi:MAG: hypothetical protein SGBAC_004053 [Bacillariaceae sp.]